MNDKFIIHPYETELYHYALKHANKDFKYIKKEMVNGKMRYYYDENTAKGTLKTAARTPSKNTAIVSNVSKLRDPGANKTMALNKDARNKLTPSSKKKAEPMSYDEYMKSLGYDEEKERAKYASSNTYNSTANNLKKLSDDVNSVMSDDERKNFEDKRAKALSAAKERDNYAKKYANGDPDVVEKQIKYWESISNKYQDECRKLHEEYSKRSKLGAKLKNAKNGLSDWLYEASGKKKSDEVRDALSKLASNGKVSEVGPNTIKKRRND